MFVGHFWYLDNWVTSMTTVDLSSMTAEERGERIYKRNGCAGCHSVDGSALVGPSFAGLWGRQENIQGMGMVDVDENYIPVIRRQVNPGARRAKKRDRQGVLAIAMPAVQVQTDPSTSDDIGIAYSPGPLPEPVEEEEEGQRTPTSPPAGYDPDAEVTFSPIAVEAEGLDDSARAALEDVRRVLTPIRPQRARGRGGRLCREK